MKKLIILILSPFILTLFLLVILVMVSGKDYVVRLYRNYTSSFERNIIIESYAGCQSRTMIDQSSDDEFSETWMKYSKELNFDAKDIDEYMMNNCPPRSDEDIEKAHRKYKEAYEKETGDHLDENEMINRISRGENIAVYQRKFLNREFTALKNEK